MSFLSEAALAKLGFAATGANILLSEKASIYGAARIRLGSNVRIDDFCILSAGDGGIEIGDHVHVAAYSSLIGAGAIRLRDFVNLSSRVSIYSSSDDYSGASMTNPMIPEAYKDVDTRPVEIGRHVIIGCGSVVLPGVTIGEGAAIGALSLVRTDCLPFTLYAGTPAVPRGERGRALLEKEAEFRAAGSGP